MDGVWIQGAHFGIESLEMRIFFSFNEEKNNNNGRQSTMWLRYACEILNDTQSQYRQQFLVIIRFTNHYYLFSVHTMNDSLKCLTTAESKQITEIIQFDWKQNVEKCNTLHIKWIKPLRKNNSFDATYSFGGCRRFCFRSKILSRKKNYCPIQMHDKLNQIMPNRVLFFKNLLLIS